MAHGVPMPVLRPDRAGYVLDQQSIDGFADRRDLGDAPRHRIATWARRFTPDALGSEQAALLERHQDAERDEDLAVARGLIDDRAELQEIYLSGLLDQLDREQRTWIQRPELHPRLTAARFPLSSGELAAMADCTEDQIRRWANANLLPCFRVGDDRRFGRGAAARALLLAGATKPEKAVLSSIARGESRRLLLLLNAITQDATAREDRLAAADRVAMAQALRAAADLLSPAPSERRPTPTSRSTSIDERARPRVAH